MLEAWAGLFADDWAGRDGGGLAGRFCAGVAATKPRERSAIQEKTRFIFMAFS
jgi:hypothetical protein